MKKLLSKFTFTFCAFMIVSTLTTFASTTYATLMSYEGWGIAGKDSVQTFIINDTDTVTINHTTTRWTNASPSASPTLDVEIRKKNFLGYFAGTGKFLSKSGTGSASKSFSLTDGHYRLYFSTSHSTAKADIKGNVTH